MRFFAGFSLVLCVSGLFWFDLDLTRHFLVFFFFFTLSVKVLIYVVSTSIDQQISYVEYSYNELEIHPPPT